MSIRLALLLTCCLSACKGGDAPGAAPGSAAPPPPETTALQRSQTALEGLPPETVGLLVAANPADLAQRLGREAVIQAIPDLYNEAATEVRRELGFDLLDPGKWSEIGVDAQGPAGLFFVGPPVSGGGFVTLSDGAKLVAFIQKMGGDEIRTEAVGDAKVISPRRGEPVVVIRGQVAYLLAGQRSAWTRGWAHHIAAQAAAQSLQADADFTAAQKSLPFGRDASGYLHVPRLVDLVINEISGRVDNARMDRFIEAARQRGDTELAAELNAERRETDGGSRREQMMMGAIRGILLGGLGPLVAGARVEDDAVRLRMKMPLGESALPRRLLAMGAGVNPIATLAGPDFMFLVGGRVNVEAGLAVLRSVALAVGEADDFERELGQVREALGLSLEDDLLKTLDGEVGFALLDQDPKIQGEQRLGITGFAGVRQLDRLKATVDQLAKHPMASQVITTTPEGFSIKNEWKPIMAAVGPRLLVTTDPGALKRLPGDGPAEHLSPGLAGILRMDGASAFGALDISLTVALTLLVQFDWEPPPPDTQNRTPEIEAKLKEWQALQTEITQARHRRQAEENEAVQRMTRPLGHLALALKLTPEGLEVEGGQFLRGSTVPQAFATLAREAAALDKASEVHWKKNEEMYRRLSEIRSQIETLDGALMPVPVPVPTEVPEPGEVAVPGEVPVPVPAEPAAPPSQAVPDDGKME